MKIKLLANIAGPEGTYKIGETIELSEKLSNALIKDGHATEVEKVAEILVEPKAEIVVKEKITEKISTNKKKAVR